MKRFEKLTRLELLDKISNTNWNQMEDLLNSLNTEIDTSLDWHYVENGNYPKNGDTVIVGYLNDSGDQSYYESGVATYFSVKGTPIWIRDNDYIGYYVEAWQYIPEYKGKK